MPVEILAGYRLLSRAVKRVVAIRSRMIKRKDQLVTSAVTLGELLAGAATRNDRKLAELYRKTLAPPVCALRG